MKYIFIMLRIVVVAVETRHATRFGGGCRKKRKKMTIQIHRRNTLSGTLANIM